METNTSFAEEGTSHMWHHPNVRRDEASGRALRTVLATYAGEVAERAEIDRRLAEAESKKPPPFPHADRAPTSRARCHECGEGIEKGGLRVVIERDIERGMTTTKGAGYLHPKCAALHLEGKGMTHDALTEAIRQNSRALSEADLDELFAIV